MRLGQAKDRTIHIVLGDIIKKQSVLVQFKARSEEGIAVLSNTITRSRSLQHTTCDLFCEGGMNED